MQNITFMFLIYKVRRLNHYFKNNLLLDNSVDESVCRCRPWRRRWISPTHTYTQAGVYPVTLTVSGPAGSNRLVRPAYVTVNTPGCLPSAFTPAANLRGT